MQSIVSFFILIPLFGFLINAIVGKKDELRLSQITFITTGLQFVLVFFYTIWWVIEGCVPFYKKQLVLVHIDDFEVVIDFMYDWTTAVFLLVGAFIAFLITTYSRNYLHREAGFKRFFITILFFYLGYNVIVLSGNLTTIFIGWEIAGVSSFLLIAYYRNRYLPVKNAVKVFSLYRVGDVCIILAMWFSHHVWHNSINLNVFSDQLSVVEHIHHNLGYSIGFSICIIVAAGIKSAQFPFSTWLPKAMEGPTPSSAIFYSSLAVHLGLLFILRTYGFWIHVPYIQELIISLGVLSYIFSTITSRIQPTIKGQIAYAVVAQVGIMMIEVALGFHALALVHFASHAMLRSYQLLISPSIVNYAIKKQFFEFKPIKRVVLPTFLRNISNSIYILSLNEWYLDRFLYRIKWGGFKQIGLLFQKTSSRFDGIVHKMIWVLAPILAFVFRFKNIYLPVVEVSFLFFALFFILKVFVEKIHITLSWYNVISTHVLLSSAILMSSMPILHLLLYVFGVSVSLVGAIYSIRYLKKQEGNIHLSGYQGHCYEHPNTEFIFFLSCLGLMGFPITTAFLGIELLFHDMKTYEIMQLVLLALVFFINGIAMIRMYARIFLGPHTKTYHESARKSS